MAVITTFPNQVIVRTPGPQGPAGSGTGPGGGISEVQGDSPIAVANGTTLPVVSLTAAGISAAYMANNAVATAAIQDGAVTAAKIAGGVINDGTVTAITAGSGLTGGTINTSGTIAHQAQPASGTGPAFVKSVEIDGFGHVTSVTGETTAGAYRTATGTDDAANLTTGLLAAARVPDLDAAKITTGTITAARLPAVSNSYTGQIETAADKTYTIDPSVVADRTIASFYARSGAGTCTATLKNDTATVGVISVTTSSTTALLGNTSVPADDPITLVISSNSSATDVVFSVEFTQ